MPSRDSCIMMRIVMSLRIKFGKRYFLSPRILRAAIMVVTAAVSHTSGNSGK